MDVERFKYSVPCEPDRWKEKVTWILERYGPIGERWEYHCSSFHFTTEGDRLMYQIAWG